MTLSSPLSKLAFTKENFPYSAGATSNVVENEPPNANRVSASTGDLFFAAINSGCVSSLFTKVHFLPLPVLDDITMHAL